MKYLAITFLFISDALFAQTASHSQPAHIPADVVDGAHNPELIPDVTAWRLWLLSVTAEDSSNPELAEARRQTFLRAAGISDVEMRVAEEVIAQFPKDYAALVNSYNKRLNAGESPSIAEFRAQRDAFVQAVQDTLSGRLETKTVDKLRNHINEEKARMKVAREGR